MKLNHAFILEKIQEETRAPLVDCIHARLGASLSIPIPDGHVHRFDIDKRGDKVGWYVLYEDADFACAIYGSWKTGEKFKWTSSSDLTESQKVRLEAHMLEADQQREKMAKVTAEIAEEIYLHLEPASPDHPYLKKKQVKADPCLMQSEGRLALPVMGKDGKLISLQYINDTGKKTFLSGGQTSGGYCIVGLDDDYDGPCYMAEGYATAMSITEATKRPCIIAFNAGNLPKVAEIFKDTMDVTIVADNDQSGTGEKYAKASGIPYKLIPVAGMDANDYAVAGYDLKEFLEPSQKIDPTSWLSSADDFVESYKPSSWLIKHWIPNKAMAMVYGAPASGKTFAVLDMLLAMSTGQPTWFGYKVKQGGVVYLAGEGHEGLRKRLKLWMQKKGVPSFGQFTIARSALDLDKVDGLRETVEAIEALPYRPSVIAIDTLNRFFSGDENSAQETRGFIESCTELQRLFECTVIIIHHTGVAAEAQQRARGSSALKGAVETEILVTKDENGLLTLKQTKQKDIDVLPDLNLKLKGYKIDGWVDEDGEPLTSAMLEAETQEDKKEKVSEETGILEKAYVWGGRKKSRGGYPFVERDTLRGYLKQELRWKDSTIRNALRNEPYRLVGKLMDAGIIEEVDAGWQVKDLTLVSVLCLTED